MGWFFGLKLHLVINERGDLLAFKLTQGHVNDRTPVTELTSGILGKLFGDKGYLSKKLFCLLFGNGLQLVTGIRSNMKNKLMPMVDKILLRKRFLIETIFDQLKYTMNIDHSRHRSPVNFLANLAAGLIAYMHQDKRPSIKFTRTGYPLVVLA